ncbi:MAG: hypothetical protein Kow0069_23720 [Promethearchaeota archaeon]
MVIGGGVTGLSLASLLVDVGCFVEVFERTPHVGGRARVTQRDGFTLDWGIHLVRFGKKSALAETLRRTQGPGDWPVRYVDVGPSHVYDECRDRWDVFPTGIIGFLKTKMASKWSLLRALSKLRRLRLPDALATPVAEFLDREGIGGGARKFLELATASMQVCPFYERASAGELKRSFDHVLAARKSVTYPEGGWAGVFVRLLNKVESGGRGAVRVGAKVRRVVVDEGVATGVVVDLKGDSKRVDADLVVCATPVQKLFDLVDPADCDDPAFVDKCNNLRPTAGVSLDIALDEPVHEGTGLTYFRDPPCFGVFTSNLDPSLAPPGKQLFTLFCPTEVATAKSPPERIKVLKRLEDLAFHAFRGMEENVAFTRPLFLPVVDGAEVAVDQYREVRPGFSIPGVSNLVLVGDGLAAPGAGGDVGHNAVWEAFRVVEKIGGKL